MTCWDPATTRPRIAPQEVGQTSPEHMGIASNVPSTIGQLENLHPLRITDLIVIGFSGFSSRLFASAIGIHMYPLLTQMNHYITIQLSDGSWTLMAATTALPGKWTLQQAPVTTWIHIL